jgi:MoaA/NifB/PqqE/SkfB family radical SAM enzyme
MGRRRVSRPGGLAGESAVSERIEVQDFALWDKLKARGAPLSFDLELTARCNNDCRHCYIALPAGDRAARAAELSAAEVLDIAGQAVELGAMWCLLTGGEPLLREDFAEVYLALRRLGLLLSVFTRAARLRRAGAAAGARLLASGRA